MAKEDPETIVLEGRLDDHEEGVTSGTVTPGEALERNGSVSGGATTEPQVQRNASDGVNRVLRVAVEQDGTGRGIDDDYSSGDKIQWKELVSGDVFYGFVFDGTNAGGSGTDVSANANVSEDDYLTFYSGSGQDGTFRAVDSDAEGAKQVQALEAVDNSAGSDPARCKFKVI